MKKHRQDGDEPKPDVGSAQSTREEDGLSPEAKIRQLEHELAYVKREVELKKLQMANMEAQRSWESKHRRK